MPTDSGGGMRKRTRIAAISKDTVRRELCRRPGALCRSNQAMPAALHARIIKGPAAFAAHRQAMAGGIAMAWDSADVQYDRRATLTEDMSRLDLIEVLEQLRFGHGHGHGPGYVTVRLDRGVHTYLIELLRERR
jgi:hypothetical protein